MAYANFFQVQIVIISAVALLYIVASIFDIHPPTHDSFESTNNNNIVSNINDGNNTPRRGRRLSMSLPEPTTNTLPPWANDNLVSITTHPDPIRQTAIFWHIPKSGGTTAKRLYECLGQTLANRLGADPRFKHDKDEEIVVFQPFETQPEINFVNVDTTSKGGIDRAARLGLVKSHKADMIFTSDINYASMNLFDPTHQGRIYSLFRNPVDRSVSKFYYLQSATWERTYRPEWNGMSMLEWATKHNADENFITKKILGKKLKDHVDIGDLIVAKEIIRQKFVVGLMNDMEESVRRFNIMLGMNVKNKRGEQCMAEYFGGHHRRLQDVKAVGDGKGKAENNMNSNPHPKVRCFHYLCIVFHRTEIYYMINMMIPTLFF